MTFTLHNQTNCYQLKSESFFQNKHECGASQQNSSRICVSRELNLFGKYTNNCCIFQIDVISREEVAADTNPSQEVKTLLRLRMSPHNVPESSRVEMLAECPIDHPFFVKDKGMFGSGKMLIAFTFSLRYIEPKEQLTSHKSGSQCIIVPDKADFLPESTSVFTIPVDDSYSNFLEPD